MGSTQGVSSTIQPIAVKLSQNLANIKHFHLNEYYKNSQVTLEAISEAISKYEKIPINYTFMQKQIKHPYTPCIKHQDLFLYIVSSETNQNIAVEGLNASCIPFPWTCFRYF